MAYHYRLETVLNVRQNLEEQVQHKLAHEIFVLDNHRQFLLQLKEGRRDLAEKFDQKKRATLSNNIYSFYVESLFNFDRQMEFQRNAIRVQEQAVAEVREELSERVKERRIVERMKEKDYLEYLQEALRKEQNEHDEMAVLRHGHGYI